MQPVTMPTEPAARKAIPLYSGVLKYFPDALLAVAELSRIGNDQHNPGQPLHWAREKSTDQHDCAARHLLESGKVDTDGVRHSTKLAWRALALLQLEIEAAAEPHGRSPMMAMADVRLVATPAGVIRKGEDHPLKRVGPMPLDADAHTIERAR